MVEVFKFGGASVRGPEEVRNVIEILRRFEDRNLVVVLSAMGKITNALEGVLEAYRNGRPDMNDLFDGVIDFHLDASRNLDLPTEFFESRLEPVIDELRRAVSEPPSENERFDYDRIVSFGEVLSSTVVSGYMHRCGLRHHWGDARTLVRTDDRYREARIDWPNTKTLIADAWKLACEQSAPDRCLMLTQGFIGHTAERLTTTLGREGSDFTASIFAFALDASRITIWKDVPGMLNADPKYFPDAVKMPEVSYKEAVELAYYGASVIHPKTIQPAQNKRIPISIRSFLHPEEVGSEIGPNEPMGIPIPAFIIKADQVLISFTTRDFSFVAEENLSELFSVFSRVGMQVHLMQNSAIDFSVVADYDEARLTAIRQACDSGYKVYYNTPCQLITIRHYDQTTIDRLIGDKTVLLEQRSRNTARYVVVDSD